MHDAIVIVRHSQRIHICSGVLSELGFSPWFYVFLHDLYIVISIRPRLLVPETDGMANLVHDEALLTTVGFARQTNGDLLHVSFHSNVRIAPGKRGCICLHISN